MKVFVPTSDGFLIDGGGQSANAALPNLPSHGAVVRLRVRSPDGKPYYRFGGSTVTVSAANGTSQWDGDGIVYVGVPAGATHLAVLDAVMNVTVGYLA